MLDIRGVFEIAIRVQDLARAEAFYIDLLGLEPGLKDERRNWHFLWVGGRGGIVVLQEVPGDLPTQHFAFGVEPAEIERAAKVFAERGIATNGPIRHEWMGGTSLYFSDPDGHELELFAAA